MFYPADVFPARNIATRRVRGVTIEVGEDTTLREANERASGFEKPSGQAAR